MVVPPAIVKAPPAVYPFEFVVLSIEIPPYTIIEPDDEFVEGVLFIE